MCPLYTKTIGGKIWKHLHGVSPGNFLEKHFKGAPPWIFPAKSKLKYTSLNTN